MAEVEPSDLVALLKEPRSDEFRVKEREKLRETISKEKVEIIYKEILGLIPEDIDNYLKNGINSALIGAIYGFCDRDLDPFSQKHYPLFKEIISEIEEAYKIVSQGNLNNELWIFETFDYGIKKVYYLDWKLYLSQICY
ncbi:MAG: hypothetical protein EBS19_01970 [Spirochaetia bacterium]|nr:hypothetical protein [Spirochaetia bacterium]